MHGEPQAPAGAGRARGLDPGALWVVLAVAMGVALTVVVFYPGYMSPDSVNQLAQGRSGSYSDWHPPVMSWLWGRLDRLAPGPASMLILHSVVFWTGLGLWIALLARRWPWWVRGLAVLGVGLFPSVFMILGTVWKDVGMAAALLLAAALLFYAGVHRSLAAAVVSLPFLWYAIAVRHNAAVAALPLLLHFGKITVDRVRGISARPALQRVGVAAVVGVGVLAGMVVTSRAATQSLTDGVTSYPIQQIYAWDLAGISAISNQLVLPDYLVVPDSFTLADVRQVYTADSVVALFCCDSSIKQLKLTSDASQVRALRESWLHALRAHFGAYVEHRIDVFARQLGFVGREVCYAYQVGIVPNNLGVTYQEPFYTRVLRETMDRVRNGLFFRSGAYLVLLAASFGGFIHLRHRASHAVAAVAAVGASGLLYGLSYLLLATSCDFRLQYWTVVASAVVTAALLYVVVQSRVFNTS